MESHDLSKPESKGASRFKGMYGKAKSFVGNIFKPRGSSQINPERRDRLQELLDRLGDPKKLLDGTIMHEQDQEAFRDYVHQMVIQGFKDGVVRHRSENYNQLSEAISEEMRIKCVATLAEKEASLSREISSRRQVVRDKQRQLRLHHDYQSYQQHHDKFNERGNTIGEFVLYLVCSLLIFLADIPLAAEMLRWLISPPKMTDPPFSILHPTQADVNPLVTAVGIGLSTIFIKVWYDKFVARKYGHAVISKKKFEELFVNAETFASEDKANQGSSKLHSDPSVHSGMNTYSLRLSESEKATIKRNELTIRIIEIILLIFTLATIAVLGIFRSYAWSAFNENGSIPTSLTATTLILVTLLFSVVSGVCLSISLNSFTTYRRLRQCKKEANALESSLVDTSKGLGAAEGKSEQLRSIKEAVAQGATWKGTIYQRLVCYYHIGYDEGVSEPGYFMQGLDFFDRILLWREQDIARIINSQAQ